MEKIIEAIKEFNETLKELSQSVKDLIIVQTDLRDKLQKIIYSTKKNIEERKLKNS